jgi:hypothetical protein
MRAIYPGATKIKRHEYRHWAIDLVIYEEDRWIAMCFPPDQMEGHRLAHFSTTQLALAAAKLYINRAIEDATVEPPKKPRGTKRGKRKKKAVPA